MENPILFGTCFFVKHRMKKVSLFVSIAITLLLSCSTREKAHNVPRCYTVWNGSFYNIVDDVANTKITRKGDRQIEKYKDGSVTELKVEWLDSCRYRLSKISGNEISQLKNFKPVSFRS